MSKLAKTARNALIADAAMAFARDRIATQLPGVQPRKRHRGRKALLIGGAVAAGALLLAKRGKVAALLPGRSDEPAPPPPPTHAPPPVSNYDARGPVENTATPVPTPPPYEPEAIDEAAEEAAAAAEAANIGGPVSDYAGNDFGEPASEEERPLMEAGEGDAEGLEQADAELVENAGPGEDGMSDAEHQIDDAIEAQSNPFEGETPEPVRPEEPLPSRDPGGRAAVRVAHLVRPLRQPLAPGGVRPRGRPPRAARSAGGVRP